MIQTRKADGQVPSSGGEQSSLPASEDVSSKVARPRMAGRLAHPLAAQVMRRLAAGVVTLIVVSMLIFLAVQVLPGNAAEVILGQRATPERVAELSSALDLDDPVVVRYWRFLSGFLTGDLGLSTAAQAAGSTVPVSAIINGPLVNSLTLAFIALVLVVMLALTLGSFAAYRIGSAVDYTVSGLSVVFTSMPEFLTATLLIALFFDVLGILPPVSQFDSADLAFQHVDVMVLPVLTLVLVSTGVTARLVRAETLEVMRKNFVAVARINGIPERQVRLRHVLRNSLAASIQAIALTAQYLIGGIVIVESVFGFPGIGALLINAIQTRDVQLVSVISTILAAMYIVINIVADVAVTLLTPKLRTSS